MSRVLKQVKLTKAPKKLEIPERPIPPPIEPQEEKQDPAYFRCTEPILRQAEERAKILLQAAEQRAKELHTQAIERGYEEGFAQGKEEGFAQGKAEGIVSAQPIIAEAKGVLAEAVARSETVQKELEQELAQLAIILAKKVVGELALEKEELVLHTAKEALKKVRGESQVTIRVNWEDLELVEEEREALLMHGDGIREVIILEDPRVERGGALIETNFGAIDARLKTQLKALEEIAEEGKNTGKA